MRSIMRKAALTGVVIIGAGLLLPPSAASASVPGPEACPPDIWYKVVKLSTGYEAIGDTAGKRNGSSTTSRLTYEMSTTTSKATSWKSELGGSASWGVATVEAKIGREVTDSTDKGQKVTNWMDVPGGKWGYTTPKIERTTFVVQKWQDTATCGARFLGNAGKLYAITAYPFFSECVASSACSPKP
ncbi:hypothetical protein [Streptomyces exfoliatus]|uniref:hypothetical protein n=1 Tax=Streptomyces exfoliatus TaxID=1905 RepID=UPI000464858C|nr:hypothetical protein [Streptomyces exfoliatus]